MAEPRGSIPNLAEAIRTGDLIGDPVGERRAIDSTELRAALLGIDGPVAAGGLRIANCDITGVLDLSFARCVVPLRFEQCSFENPLRLEAAELPALSFDRCELPGINANGLKLARDLVFDNATAVRGALASLASTHHTAAVWLCEAEIGGRLLVRGSEIDGRGGRSVQADRLRIGANIRFLNGSVATGEMRLLSARIAGSMDIVASTITADRETALELAEAQLGGSIFITDDTRYPTPTRIDGIIVLSDVKVGAFLRVKGATLTGRRATATDPFDRPVRHAQHVAISAPRIEVGDDLVIDADCRITGALLWPHSTVLGDVVLNGVTIDNPDDRALDFGGAEIRGSLVGRGMRALGSTWLAGARVGASVALGRASLSGANGRSALLATGIKIAGDLQLDDVEVAGGSVRFRAAEIGGEIDARRATFLNPGGETLSLSHARVGGAVHLGGVTSTGLLAINRASIAGRLRLTGADLSCDETWDRNLRGDALEVISSEVRGGMYLDWKRVGPSLDFFSSTTSVVADDVNTWPQRADLSGFTYERFDVPGPVGRSPWNLDDRLRILSTQDPFDLGPYEHAAAVYRAHGRFSDAEEILIAGRRRAVREEVAAAGTTGAGVRRRVVGRSLQVGSKLYDISVRFGFRPARALGLIVALVLLVWLSLVGPWSGSQQVMRATDASGAVYTPEGPVAEMPTAVDGCAQVRCFSPLIYAIETVVPLVDLGQRGTWYVRSSAAHGTLYDVWFTIATLSGWALSTVFLLSFSRLGRSS